ncbi:MAG TPA: RNA polymerase sigma factor [Burkholderiales bacterium]|nr:RNA polymerase sigma factor [Burkholderiales bacterium]
MQTAIRPQAAPATDEMLVERVRAGDLGALEALMRRHNRLLYRTARAILRDDAEAEDAVQEAYLRAYRALHAFRGESKFSTWLVRIAANEALMRRRRNARAAAVVPIDAAAELQAEGKAGDDMLRRLLEKRIDALPDDYRAVFVLRALEELSVEETAVALGIPQATVRTRHFRARSLLRESLAREIDLTLEDAFGFDGERCDRTVAKVLERIRAGT